MTQNNIVLFCDYLKTMRLITKDDEILELNNRVMNSLTSQLIITGYSSFLLSTKVNYEEAQTYSMINKCANGYLAERDIIILQSKNESIINHNIKEFNTLLLAGANHCIQTMLKYKDKKVIAGFCSDYNNFEIDVNLEYYNLIKKNNCQLISELDGDKVYCLIKRN